MATSTWQAATLVKCVSVKPWLVIPGDDEAGGSGGKSTGGKAGTDGGGSGGATGGADGASEFAG